MSDWLTEIEEEMNTPTNTPQVQPIKQQTSDDKLVLPLFFVFLLLVVLLTGVFVWKSNSNNMDYYPPYANDTSEPLAPPAPNNELQELHDAIDKNWRLTNRNSELVRLLAIIDNNNMIVVKHGYPRNDLIFINEDWTINQMPKYVRLSQDDAEFLRKFVRS